MHTQHHGTQAARQNAANQNLATSAPNQDLHYLKTMSNNFKHAVFFIINFEKLLDPSIQYYKP